MPHEEELASSGTRAPPLGETLRAHPGWERLTAFERAKLCCAELVRRGERVPNWQIIRDIIGKGSATDINRAKEAFRREHAEALRALEPVLAGVPDEARQALSELWRAAAALAADRFAAERLRLEEQVRTAREEARAAEAARLAAEASLSRTQEELADERDRRRATEEDGLRWQERAAAAERLAAEAARRLEQERSAFRDAMAERDAALRAALERLEGAEAFALQRIEEARTEAERRLREERRRHEAERADLRRRIEELAEANAALARAETAARTRLTALRIELQRLRRSLVSRLRCGPGRMPTRAALRARFAADPGDAI